jgi:hypothetical protein
MPQKLADSPVPVLDAPPALQIEGPLARITLRRRARPTA